MMARAGEFEARLLWFARNHTAVALLASGFVFLFSVYLAIFVTTNEAPYASDLRDAFGNSITAIAWSGVAYWAIHRFVLGRRWWLQALLHFGLALAFAICWYVSYLSLSGWLRGSLAGGNLTIRQFLPIVVGWQIFQGMVLYAAWAASIVAVEARRRMLLAEERARVAELAAGTRPPEPTRLMVRGDDELLPLEVDEIVAIRGSDDYSEVLTPTGRRLVRRSLSAFARDLPTTRFVRVHRSWIVNLDRLVRAEPAGNGRLQLSLSHGDPIVASRTGSRLLRERVI
jgi:two-component system LytT family response regulator